MGFKCRSEPEDWRKKVVRMKQKKMIAIITAAGQGSRMKSDKNKVYLDLLGRPVMTYSIEAFQKSKIDEIVLVVTPGDEEYVQSLVKEYGYTKVTTIVSGGRERFESVYFGICACKESGGEDYIFIHDNARPFIRPEQINTCIEAVQEYKACVMAMPVKDTVRIVDADGYPVMTPDRRDVWQMQTPQCFLLSEAKQAFQAMMEAGDTNITDDVMVLERYGNRRSKMIVGSYENMKLTTPEDMIVGENILKKYRGDRE